MKTNKILMAMVLAAGFTACTSEDVVESTQNVALNNRKVLGDIEFVMGEGVDSRFAIENGTWKIEAGDAFGAVLVDEPNGNEEEVAYKNYSLVDYIQTNYRYAKAEGSNKFTTPARMVEGNYVFYAPYNEKHLTRKPMEVAFPISQTLDVVDGKVNPFSTINNAIKEGYPFFVDYKFLSAEDQETSLTINFKHLYSYPEVTFANESDEDITVEKFIVYLGEGGSVTVNGSLDLIGGLTGKVAAADATGVVGNLFNLGTEKTEENADDETAVSWGNWVNYEVQESVNKLVDGTTSDMIKDAKVVSTHISIDVPEGLKVKAGEEVKFHIVLPAEAYKATVYAMVDAEEGYKAAFKNSRTFIPGQRYPMSDFKPDGSLRAADKIGQDFMFAPEEEEDLKDLTEENIYAPVVVSTTAELNDEISKGKGTLAVIAGKEVVYNNSVIEALENSDVEKIQVLSDLSIAGGANADKTLKLENLVVKGTATIKSGHVTSNVNLGKVVVAKDATLVVKAAVTDLTNNGTVKADKGSNIAASTNLNVMEIAEKSAKVTVDNKKTLNITAALTNSNQLAITNYFPADETAGIAAVSGEVNVSKDYTTTHLNGTWNVTAGVLDVASATIAGKVTVSAGAYLGSAESVLTIVGGGELEVNGRVDAKNIYINGTKAVADTDPEDDEDDSVALSKATLDLKEGAFIQAVVSYSGTAGDYTSNIMEVADNVEFLTAYNKASNTNIQSKYNYTGNLLGNEENFGIPTECNTFVMEGSVSATKENIDLTGLTNIEISGGVLVNGYDVTFPASGAKIAIGGKLEAITGTIDLGSNEVSVAGMVDVKTTGTLTTTGKFTATKEINIQKATTFGQLVMKGSKITAKTADNELSVNTLEVEATNLEFNGNMLVNVINVYLNKKLTIASGSTVTEKTADSKVTINFVENKTSHDGDEIDEEDLEDYDAGVVVNKGTITEAAEAYEFEGGGSVTVA